MRTLILAGAAILALGTLSTTAANAGATWTAKKAVKHCEYQVKHSTEGNCLYNEVGHGNNNTQNKNLQVNGGLVSKYDIKKVDQNNIGVNVIKKGSYNKQQVKQVNLVFGDIGRHDEVDQDNLAVNTLDKGYGNKQKATQVNLAAGDLEGDVEQSNKSTNTIGHGNGNTQQNTQVNVAIGDIDDDVKQTNTATNTIGSGNGNYQGGTQVNALVAY